MSAIPDDIMKTARQFLAEQADQSPGTDASGIRAGSWDHLAAIKAIAAALLAERERCAAEIAAAERRGIERAARLLDARGVNSCERGSVDYSTGAFECRRLDRGDCNCGEFDELAEEIRALSASSERICAARRGNTGPDDPQDCNWPMCGCDDYANKVVAALEESGALAPAQPVARDEAIRRLIDAASEFVWLDRLVVRETPELRARVVDLRNALEPFVTESAGLPGTEEQK